MTNSVGVAVAAPSSTSRPSAGHIVLVVMVFFGALTATCLSLNRWLPFPVVPGVQEKMEHLARNGDDYDVLFIGSSRVHFQVLPAIFDQIAREQGLPIRSFNAAISAMAPPEDNYVLDQILRRSHKRLRWVILEVMPAGSGKGDPILSGTRRFSYWHDWERTWLLTRRFIQDSVSGHDTRDWYDIRPFGERRGFARAFGIWLDNLALFVENCSNVGRGEAWAMWMSGPIKKSQKVSLETDKTWDGWAFPKIAKVLAGERLANYQRDYAGLLEQKERFDRGDALSWEVLRAKINRLADAKVTPILIIPPAVGGRRYFPLQLASQSLTVWDFSDPREYPELFALDHRLDGQHLNYEGAEIFTKLLVQKYLETVKKNGQGP